MAKVSDLLEFFISFSFGTTIQRKILREKTSRIGDFLWRKLLQIAHFCHAKRRHTPNFAEKTFANSHKTVKFTKVSSSKVSRYTVDQGHVLEQR